MRYLVAIVAVVLAIWTGFWFFLAGQIEDGATRYLAEQAGRGREIRYESLDVSGYPYRFELDVTAPFVASRDGAVTWQAPRLRAEALAYAPTHIIASFPDSQSLTLGALRLDLATERMQASLRTDPTPSLPLDHMTVEAEGINLSTNAGWGLTAEKAIFATRQSEMTGAAPDAHDLVLQLAGFTPDAALRARIDPDGRMAPVIGPVGLDATVTLDAPVDRAIFAPGARLPELIRLDLRNGSLVWGESSIRVSGQLDFGPAGLAEGTLQLSVAGWQDILRLAVSFGLVPEGQRRAVEQGMRLLEATRFGPKTLDLSLPVREGVVLLGPLPVATLPRALRQQGF